MTRHAEARLNERVRDCHKDIAARLMNAAMDVYDTALVAKVSDRLSLVVIARGFTASTTFYCETNRVTVSHLHVSTIVTL